MKAREITKKLGAYCKRRCVLGDIAKCQVADCPLWQLFDETTKQMEERRKGRKAMSDSQLSNLNKSHRRKGITDEIHLSENGNETANILIDE